MKKKILLLTVVVCAFLMFGSVSVFAAGGDALLPADAALVPSDEAPADIGFFPDVMPKSWYYNYVRFAAVNGIFNGYPDGTFNPDREMSRAEVARVLYALEKEPASEFIGAFTDVKETDWFAKPVEWAAKTGVVAGYPDGTYGPNQSITRQEFVAMLYRFAQMKKYDVSELKELNFPDNAEVADYAETAFQWAMAEEIISGSQEGDSIYLRPKNNTSRAQVAKMLSVFTVEYMKLGAVEKVEFYSDSYTLTAGASVLATGNLVYVEPDTAYDEMKWTSSDESVAKVSRGVITGVAQGKATITCTTFDGKSASIAITVTDKPVDPYQDVVDFLFLHGEGDWRENLSYLYKETVDGWDFWYGLNLDCSDNTFSFVSESYDGEDTFSSDTEMFVIKDSSKCVCHIEVIDNDEGLTWKGSVTIDAASFTKETPLVLDSFTCSDAAFVTDEMKKVVTSYLQEDIDFLLTAVNDIFHDAGLKVTVKDFGFAKY